MRGGFLHLILSRIQKVGRLCSVRTYMGWCFLALTSFAIWCLGGQASSPFVFSLCHHNNRIFIRIFLAPRAPGLGKSAVGTHSFSTRWRICRFSKRSYFQLYQYPRPPLDDERPERMGIFFFPSSLRRKGGGGANISVCVLPLKYPTIYRLKGCKI